jgi:phage tail-like protein
MKSTRPTFWLLDGRNRWGADLNRIAPVSRGAVAGARSLRLAANPAGPLGLTWPDGSLGGLVLPRRFAIGPSGALYLLGPPSDPWLKKFDRPARTFVTQPGIGGAGREPRSFYQPESIAASRRLLYVADSGNGRVQAFTHGALSLRHLWEGLNTRWRPLDVAALANRAYVLDDLGRVYEHSAGAEPLRRIALGDAERPGHWTRIAIDRAGLIYLVAEATFTAPFLAIYDRQGKPQPLAEDEPDDAPPDAEPYRDRFDPVPLRTDEKERFCLSGTWFSDCPPSCIPSIGDPAQPLGGCPPQSASGRIFDAGGNPITVDPARAVGAPVYRVSGSWVSASLDSLIHRCQWHRIEMKLSTLPVGTRVKISTYASDQPLLPEGVVNCEDPDGCALVWDLSYQVSGSMKSRKNPAARPGTVCPGPALPACSGAQSASNPASSELHEFLVHSREGRYLWIKVELSGDGYSTPAIESLTIHFPRTSYLNYLPAFYSADDEGRRFLEAFLSVEQTTWDDLGCEISNFARYFDPKAVPAGAPLDYLARWLGLTVDASLSDEQRRRLLVAAPAAAAIRGTVTALRENLAAVLRNIGGPPAEGSRAFPLLIEGFRERRRITLGVPAFDQLGSVEPATGQSGSSGQAGPARVEHGTPLWSDSVVGRIRLGSFDRAGDARIISTGEPGLDVFQQRAHRFRVIVPAVWVTSAHAEQMLRRAIETEKPAHTCYDLCLLEPRFRLGVQATVGVDTLVAASHSLRLAPLTDPGAAPSRSPRHRLGVDTVLARSIDHDPTLRIGTGDRVGVDTLLL